MFTKETVCSEIEKIMEQPMTPDRAAVLANLLYIRRHSFGHEDEPKRTEKDVFFDWVAGMENADGTTGPHWLMSDTEKVRASLGFNCEPVAFYVTMNMMYSDYCEALGQSGIHPTPDLYARLAEAFLDDKDAQPHKLARYYEYIACHE